MPRIKLNISHENLKGALNNDLVSFRKIGNEASKEAEVVSIIERFKTKFVAEIIFASKTMISVFFDDPQLSGLRKVYGYFHNLKVGEKVVILLNSFPPKKIEGEIIKILGNSNSGKTEFFSLIADLKLPGKFENENIQKEIKRLSK